MLCDWKQILRDRSQILRNRSQILRDIIFMRSHLAEILSLQICPFRYKSFAIHIWIFRDLYMNFEIFTRKMPQYSH